MLRKEHQSMIDTVVREVENDSRFAGLAIGGSYIAGEMDEFSDLDFVLVAKNECYQEVMKERYSVVNTFGKLLAAFSGEHVGEPRVLICLYDEPMLHVDCKFISLRDLPDRVEDPVILYEEGGCISEAFARSEAVYPVTGLQWMEDRFWVWVHYLATKIGRNELFEVIDCLDFLRRTVLFPLKCREYGKLPRGARKIEAEMPQDVDELERTVAVHEVNSCVCAARASIALYRKLREQCAQPELMRHTGAEEKAMAYFDEQAARRQNDPLSTAGAPV